MLMLSLQDHKAFNVFSVSRKCCLLDDDSCIENLIDNWVLFFGVNLRPQVDRPR